MFLSIRASPKELVCSERSDHFPFFLLMNNSSAMKGDVDVNMGSLLMCMFMSRQSHVYDYVKIHVVWLAKHDTNVDLAANFDVMWPPLKECM